MHIKKHAKKLATHAAKGVRDASKNSYIRKNVRGAANKVKGGVAKSIAGATGLKHSYVRKQVGKASHSMAKRAEKATGIAFTSKSLPTKGPGAVA